MHLSSYKEQEDKLQFWNNTNFYGIDLTCALEKACDEYFTQAVVGMRAFIKIY